jgi:polysaccharide biosynthesis/export protein
MIQLTRAASLLALFATLVAAPMAAAQAQAPAAASAPAVATSYRIGAGDVLRITVYQSPDLSLETRVTEAGVISFPLVGKVAVGGQNVTDAEAQLADALRKGEFVKNPQVMIVVTQVRANQANVLGQVAKPGRIPLDVTGMRLTEVLALAGGVAAGSGSDTIVLVGERQGKPHRQEIDLPRVFTPAGRADDVVIMPGDTLWVDRAPVIYVYGQVQRPGQLRLERGMTLTQALAAAGGLTLRGTQKGVQVTRRTDDGRTATSEPALDAALRADDVVFVRESLF